MDPLHFCVAVGPLSAYLLLIGILNLLRTPFLTNGARDTAALGIAISGFVVAGPMELFMPQVAAMRFGIWVWVLMIAFYALSLTLVVLLMRPRLVVYNMTADQLRPLLATVVAKLDNEHRWAGETLSLPHLAVELHLEPFSPLRNVQLVSAGPRQSYKGWRILEAELGAALHASRTSRNPYGFALLAMGAVLSIAVGTVLVMHGDTVSQSLAEMLL